MKNTWKAKNRLSVAPPIVSPARMKRAMSRPMHRHPARLGRADDDRPDRVLVPAQQLPGERQRQREQQQHRAGQPVELAGELVRRHQVGARDVDADQQHHGRRAEVVHPAEEAAEQRLLGDELEAVVGLAARGHVRRGERDAGHHLQHERDAGGAAEHVPPAGPRRHRVLERAPRRRSAGRCDRRARRGSVSPRGPQTIGIGLVRISTWPSRTRTGYCGSGLGGGPAETVPSA